jgi:hypothetical protein
MLRILSLAVLASTGCTGAGMDTPDAAFDCTRTPPAPLSVTELGAPRGHHDVAFDQEGNIIGAFGSSLVSATRDGSLVPYAAGLDTVEGMDVLPDGTLVVACSAGLVSILPGGAQVTLAPDIHAYGVTVGPDGLVYAADHHRVHRVDPVTRVSTVVLDPSTFGATWQPRTIEFTLEYTQMYVGTFGDAIYVVDLDEHLDPVSPPRLFATPNPGSSWMDGLALDVCGNLYVPIWESKALYRISPLGQVEVFHQFDGEHYGHGVTWGSGLGGWRTDALYLPQPWELNGVVDSVVEVVVGVPGRFITPPRPLEPERPHELLGCAMAAPGGWALPLLVLLALAGIRCRRGRGRSRPGTRS